MKCNSRFSLMKKSSGRGSEESMHAYQVLMTPERLSYFIHVISPTQGRDSMAA